MPRWLDVAGAWSWRLVVIGVVVLWVIDLLAQLAFVTTLPLIVAVILTAIFAPPTRWLEGRGLPPTVATLITVVGSLVAFGGVVALLVPSFADQLQDLRPTISEGLDKVFAWAANGPLDLSQERIRELLDQARESLTSNSDGIVSGVLSGAALAVQAIAGLVLLVVLLFFFVKDGPAIVEWGRARTPERHREVVSAVSERVWSALGGYIRGTALIAFIDAVGIAIGLLVLGVPLVLPLAFFVFLGGFLPVIGAFLAGMVAALVALAANGLLNAALVVAWILAVQQIEGNILQPTIMRRAIALHPIVILVALTAGAGLAGITGAFLSVPIAAALSAAGNELRLRAEAGRSAGEDPLGPEALEAGQR